MPPVPIQEEKSLTKAEDLDMVRDVVHKVDELTQQKTKVMSDTFSDTEPKGAFFESLTRNNKTIKRDRATAIFEDCQMRYKRELEDMELEMKKLRRERTALLDLSPTDANSLMLANDFDAKGFVERDIAIGGKIRNLSIRIEIARESFTNLFGE